MSDSPLWPLYDDRANPATRAVLDDAQQEAGQRFVRLGLGLAAAAADDADADAAGAAAADDADADAQAILKRRFKLLTEEIDMREGLKLMQMPGRYGYAVTRVGWVRRVGGDEYELVGAVTVAWTGGKRTSLSELASDGPGKNHMCTKPAKGVEELHRLTVRRPMPANVKAWRDVCPMPSGWHE